MRLVLASAVAASAVLLPAAAHAIEDPYIAARASTLGLGVEAGAKVLPHVRLRGVVGALDIDYDDTVDDVRYDGKVKLNSYGLNADFFPLDEGPFFISAGIYSNKNRIDAAASPTTNTQIGGVTFTPEQIGTITAQARYKDSAPYLGVGAEWSLYPAVISLEAGAYFQGEPKVTMTSDGTFASNSIYQDAMETERRNLEEDLKDTKTYPAVTLSVGFRF